MKDERKTKKQLVDEAAKARRRIARLEKSEAERKRTESRLAKETKAVGAILSNILLGELDDAKTEMQVMNACLDATNSTYGMIGVVNEHGKYDTTTYNSRTMQDCAFPEALAWELSTGMTIRGIWGRPMLHGEPVLCNDLPAHPDRVGYPEGHVPIDCYLGVPLKDDEKVVGMISVANKPGGYTEDDKCTLVRLASVVDISRQRKRMEEALRQSKTKYHDLYHELYKSAPVAYFSVGTDSLIRVANNAAEKLTGYRLEELQGMKVDDLYAEESKAKAKKMFEQFTQGIPSENEEMIYKRKNGQKVYGILSVSPIRDESGRVVESRSVVVDITEHKHLEAQLRQAQKMEAIGRLAGGIAHDFNNMLMAIGGYADLALENVSEESPLRKDLEEIQKTASRAALLTRDILAFSRRQVLEPRVVSLNTVVSSVEGMLRRLIGERVALKFVLSPDLELTEVDPHQIEQVLMNLAVNARDAMPEGGRLTIETKNADLDEQYVQSHHAVEPGRYMLLSVSDTGCGIPEEMQDRIFEPFFSTKEKGKGTGFGLSTSYGIIKQHGGHIRVYSEEGIGTVFKVYLPVTQKRQAEESAFPEQPRTLPLGTELVLLVEDEPAVRGVLERNLKKLGYEVVAASCGEEALELLEAAPRPPDLLITDVVMPGVAGPELALKIKARNPGTKIVFISGYADAAVHINGVLKEEAHFLQKPFAAKDIAQKLREVLNEPARK